MAVRPKASKRKTRSQSLEHKARSPSQGRSQQRFKAILAATTELLAEANIEDLSFNDIAVRAGVSPASIHYHFPSMAALRRELAKAANESMIAWVVAEQRQRLNTRDPRWQTWTREVNRAACDFLNENRYLCEILLGPTLHREARLAAIQYNDETAQGILDGLNDVFVLPEVPGLLEKFRVVCEFNDALWSRSYILHGRITEAAFEETLQLQIAYLRTALPEVLMLRPPAPPAPAES
jgi:AcrR family transcriptional regulator